MERWVDVPYRLPYHHGGRAVRDPKTHNLVLEEVVPPQAEREKACPQDHYQDKPERRACSL